ncbi:MAG: hypothetical protein RQ966_18050 [Acetobacteraceae bacterium]|nr:hypothetical protein [Acetobacteraceae bacterium]
MPNELTSPRVKVTLSGIQLPGVLSVEVDSNNHFAADRFRLRFAASLVPQEILHIPGSQIEIAIERGDQWRECLVGIIDAVQLNPTQGIVDVEGRDLSCQLIETQTSETFSNRTASEVAVILGARHGLVVLADPTTTPIGRYYQSEHDRISLNQFTRTMTEWDLLAALAAREGFDLFTTGRVLRFGRASSADAQVITLEDCIELRLGHCVGLARPIDVTVKSWNSKGGTAVSGHAVSIGLGPIWQRKIARPNLSNADAQSLAQQTINDLKRHEWTASVTMPGELTLSARTLVLIQGTGTLWDRPYHVSELSRRLDVKRGFTQSLTLHGVP